MSNQNKRERLIDSAAELFHKNGMNATSLADIAKDADIPIGNVYYYFKTKEELALAAVNKRREHFSAAYALLDDRFDNPRQRLIEATNYFEKVREDYAKYGCPVGKVIDDADVEKDSVAKSAAQIFGDFVDWAERQFSLLGHGADARRYATSLMAGIQGSIFMAKAFKNPQVISAENARLVSWLEALPNKRISLGKVGARVAETSGAK